MLELICNTRGVSGYEAAMSEMIYGMLSDEDLDDLKIDNVGNVICYKKGINSNKIIMISAHLDEVGFQVIKKISEYKYRIKPIGNIKTWNAYQQRVQSDNFKGIIRAFDEENLKSHNYENLYLECYSEQDVNIGEVFTFSEDFEENDKNYCGKALDDRIACYLLIKMIKKSIKTNNDIYYVFTAQEEIGMRGDRVAKTTIKPDCCVSIDTTPECDMNSIEFMQGVGIKISDSLGISSKKYVDCLEKIAINNNINFQFEVSDCGTCEVIISNEQDFGHDEVGISIPCKYPHSSCTIVSKDDVEACEMLLYEFICRL